MEHFCMFNDIPNMMMMNNNLGGEDCNNGVKNKDKILRAVTVLRTLSRFCCG